MLYIYALMSRRVQQSIRRVTFSFELFFSYVCTLILGHFTYMTFLDVMFTNNSLLHETLVVCVLVHSIYLNVLAKTKIPIYEQKSMLQFFLRVLNQRCLINKHTNKMQYINLS